MFPRFFAKIFDTIGIIRVRNTIKRSALLSFQNYIDSFVYEMIFNKSIKDSNSVSMFLWTNFGHDII